MGIGLEDDELWEYVAAAHTGVLVTSDRDGWPIPLPTWFVVIDRAVYLRTPAGARKVGRIRRDGRAGFLVESGRSWTELRAAVLCGTAEIVDDPSIARTVGAAMADKYRDARPPTRRLPDATRRHYSRGDAVIRFVASKRTISWDNSRIALARG